MSDWEADNKNTPLSILKTEETYSEADLAEVIDYAEIGLRLSIRRFLYSIAGFLLCCASVVPFSDGHSLHSHWDAIGKYLVLLSMGAWLVVVLCVGLMWSSWKGLHDLKKEAD